MLLSCTCIYVCVCEEQLQLHVRIGNGYPFQCVYLIYQNQYLDLAIFVTDRIGSDRINSDNIHKVGIRLYYP